MGFWYPRLDVGHTCIWRLSVVLVLCHGLLVVAQNNSFPTPEVPVNGTGAAYASACQSAYLDFSSSAWTFSQTGKRETTYTLTSGGTGLRSVTFYANATTLCDGHARVSSSEQLVPLSTALLPYDDGPLSYSVTTDTYFPFYSQPTPSCSIEPSDCDPLWQSYTTSVSARKAQPPQITVAPVFTPPCMNISAYESYTSALASVRSCGPCTIYGDFVQLLYFPTSASRDMCASTPTAPLTSFHIDATPLDIYTGKGPNVTRGSYNPDAVTAVVDGHTFTSNTAYVSIGAVWASDRCDQQIGTTVRDVVVALQPESVLSVRYSHAFSYYFQESSVQTGYPVSYADFITPIPWSAWNGQAVCGGPCRGCGCDVIFDDQFFPQLAVPPGLRQLNELWSTCQFAYWGLHDPPLTLGQEDTFATPTFAPTTTRATTTRQGMEAAPAPTTVNTVTPTAMPTQRLNPNLPQATPDGGATPGDGATPGGGAMPGGGADPAAPNAGERGGFTRDEFQAGDPAGGAVPSAANPGGPGAPTGVRLTTDATGGVVTIHGAPSAPITGGGNTPVGYPGLTSDSPVTAGPTQATFATPSRPGDDSNESQAFNSDTAVSSGTHTMTSSAGFTAGTSGQTGAPSNGGGSTTTSDSSLTSASSWTLAASLMLCLFVVRCLPV